MVRSGDASVIVLVGDEQLKEYVDNSNGRSYVEMDLMHRTSYDVEYRDPTPWGLEVHSWPVTPYHVRVSYTGSDYEKVNAVLSIDGEEIDNIHVTPGSSATFKGFSSITRQRGEIREFLFALPRFAHVGDAAAARDRLDQLGTISVTFQGMRRGAGKFQAFASNQGFQQANKDQVSTVMEARSGQDDFKVGTTREGRVLDATKQQKRGNKEGGRWCTFSWHHTGPKIGPLTLLYRQRDVLQRLRLIAPPSMQDANDAFNHLFIHLRSSLNDHSSCGDTLGAWSDVRDKCVATGKAGFLMAMPSPVTCYAPKRVVGACIKVKLGDTFIPHVGASADNDLAALRARFESDAQLRAVAYDSNSVLSAAALALFGCEELYFVLRHRIAMEAAAYPRRYGESFASDLSRGLSAEVSPDWLLQVRAPCVQ